MKNEPGVYIAMLLSDKTNQKIKEFCSGFNIDLDNAKPIFNEGPLSKGLHSSLIFSEVGDHKKVVIPDDIHSGHIISSKAIGWEVRHSNITGKKTLGLKIESSALLNLHEQVKIDNELIHKFPDYTPHITLHYDFEGEVPSELPNFDIELSGVYIKKLENDAPKVVAKNDYDSKFKFTLKNNRTLVRSAIANIRNKSLQKQTPLHFKNN